MNNKKHNLLILGSGGREHAILKKILQSRKVNKIFVCPGNAGTANSATNISIDLSNYDEIIDFVKINNISLTIVGPEQPLVDGLVDIFKNEGLNIFGPSKNAARIEGSKIWAYELMKKYDIPCPESEIFTDSHLARQYIKNFKPENLVLKADGLAAGKGVFIPKTHEEINLAIEAIMDKKIFGDSSSRLLISKRIFGPEVSVFSFVNAGKASDLAAVCDYKRIFENDEGPNTGGVGAYSPPEFWNENLSNKIRDKILYPTIHALEVENSTYTGILYIGIMITKDGPMVIEYNCRFGDPETQILMSKLDSDLFEICMDISNNKLDVSKVSWNDKKYCFVMMTSTGYPGKYETGYLINGLENLDKLNVIHSGTKLFSDNSIRTDGGRVVGVVGEGDNMSQAINNSYFGIQRISFQNSFYRKDIGKRALNKR
ncbi:MAG: phosphoribosylamine--glycine ligase [Dehalococcoidia bacterium]